jgi:bifunctional non-homologous end joining protein LigD
VSRNGKDRTARFPRIAAAIADLSATTLLLDGEVVAVDSHGISRFQLLQQAKGDPVYAVFDCLFFNGKDLRDQPLSARRRIMESAIGSTPLITPSRRLADNGIEAFRLAQHLGYEGLVAKDDSSRYVEARSSRWLKVKIRQEDEFLICGYTRPAGARQHFGALLLGAYQGADLRYVGKVGTGFDRTSLAALHHRLVPLVNAQPSLVDPPRAKDVVFVVPKLIAQIAFQELTADRKLRQPVFLGLRDDKSPREVLMPGHSDRGP